LILEALAYETRGARAEARATLLQACQLARIENYQRPFLDEGEHIEMPLKALLRDLPEGALATYVQSLLRSFAAVHAPPDAAISPNASLLPEPLTPQEQRVLHLLADGASNQDIADRLIISLTTAKKHVANILSKLGVQNRTQAVMRAREYTLI
jgi:LuxR family maltose regulon positive regulatory protein